MPAHHQPLKLLHHERAAAVLARDADLAGLGLDWSKPPTGLDRPARAVWRHLATTFADQPVRFREGDRAAVTAFCVSRSLHEAAGAALMAGGLLAEGRSSADRGRQVRSPAFQLWRDTGEAMRKWARELALTPSSRSAMGLLDEPNPIDDATNPFAGGAS